MYKIKEYRTAYILYITLHLYVDLIYKKGLEFTPLPHKTLSQH